MLFANVYRLGAFKGAWVRVGGGEAVQLLGAPTRAWFTIKTFKTCSIWSNNCGNLDITFTTWVRVWGGEAVQLLTALPWRKEGLKLGLWETLPLVLKLVSEWGGGKLSTCLELCLDAGDSKAPHHESHQYQCLRSSLSKNWGANIWSHCSKKSYDPH